MKSVTICTAQLVDHEAPITLDELARFCEPQTDWGLSLVDQGVVPATKAPVSGQWVFTSVSVVRARDVARLQRDLEVNLDAAALMVDLMQEVRHLRGRLSLLK